MKLRLNVSATFGIHICLICFVFLFARSVAAADPAPKAVTVGEVLKMLENGITEDVIAAKLKKANSSLDLSTDEMVALKKAGATPVLLKMMIDPSSTDKKLPSKSTSDEGQDDDENFYLFDGDKKTPLQLASAELNTKSTGAALITGGVRAYMTLSKSGPTAEIRTTNSVPQFGELAIPLNMRVQEAVQLVKLELNGDKRRRWESAKGGAFQGVKMSNKNALELAFEEVGQRKYKGKQVRIYKAKPLVPLSPGEYGIVISMQQCFDFGIDPQPK